MFYILRTAFPPRAARGTPTVSVQRPARFHTRADRPLSHPRDRRLRRASVLAYQKRQHSKEIERPIPMPGLSLLTNPGEHHIALTALVRLPAVMARHPELVWPVQLPHPSAVVPPRYRPTQAT